MSRPQPKRGEQVNVKLLNGTFRAKIKKVLADSLCEVSPVNQPTRVWVVGFEHCSRIRNAH